MDGHRNLHIPLARIGLLFSGGLDSTAALALLRADGYDVTLIEVEHANRPEGERIAAASVAAHFASPRIVVRVDFGSLSSPESPRPSTILLALIAEHAARALAVQDIVMATIREDWEVHGEPEAGEYYLSTVQRILRLHSPTPVRLHMPFREHSKVQLVKSALMIGAPLHLSWSCITANGKPCGSCTPCLEAMAAIAALQTPM